MTVSAGNEVTDGTNTINWLNATENIMTGSGADSITGDSGDNVISSGAGADNILAGAGNDTINGGAGNDTIDGGTGSNTYVFANGWGSDSVTNSSSSGLDTMDLSAVTSSLSVNISPTSSNEVTDGTNIINWSNAIKVLQTGSGNDTVYGDSADNMLSTNGGNDTLYGGTGNDTLAGGSGNDVYQFAKGRDQDLITDSSGTDRIQLDSSITKLDVAFFQTEGGDLQVGWTDNTGDLITVQNQNNVDTAVERIQLSDGIYMTSVDINLVIQAMSSYATANSVSFSSLSDVENNSNLLAIVNSGWHS
jgi:Ca2+-binding RTX toxin-like protein